MYVLNIVVVATVNPSSPCRIPPFMISFLKKANNE